MRLLDIFEKAKRKGPLLRYFEKALTSLIPSEHNSSQHAGTRAVPLMPRSVPYSIRGLPGSESCSSYKFLHLPSPSFHFFRSLTPTSCPLCSPSFGNSELCSLSEQSSVLSCCTSNPSGMLPGASRTHSPALHPLPVLSAIARDDITHWFASLLLLQGKYC